MKRIELTQGKLALIDDEDLDLVNQYKWYAAFKRGRWYAVTMVRKPNGLRMTLRMHRLILNVKLDKDVDHKDHNGLNNQKYNLRSCTNAENSYNQTKQRKKTSSKFKGVNWDIQVNKWKTRIGIKYKRIHLGYFSFEVDAAKAYNKAAIKYFGEFAELNNI